MININDAIFYAVDAVLSLSKSCAYDGYKNGNFRQYVRHDVFRDAIYILEPPNIASRPYEAISVRRTISLYLTNFFHFV